MLMMEWLAVIFAVLVLVKIVVTLSKPTLRIELIEKAAHHTTFTSILYLVITVLCGYVVIGQLGIVNVGAAMLFSYFLMGFAIMPYVKPLVKLTKPYLKDPSGLLMRSWPSLLIWLAMSVWILWTVFR